MCMLHSSDVFSRAKLRQGGASSRSWVPEVTSRRQRTKQTSRLLCCCFLLCITNKCFFYFESSCKALKVTFLSVHKVDFHLFPLPNNFGQEVFQVLEEQTDFPLKRQNHGGQSLKQMGRRFLRQMRAQLLYIHSFFFLQCDELVVTEDILLTKGHECHSKK